MSNPDLPPDSITTLPPDDRLAAIRERYNDTAYSGPTPADRERDTVIGFLLDHAENLTSQLAQARARVEDLEPGTLRSSDDLPDETPLFTTRRLFKAIEARVTAVEKALGIEADPSAAVSSQGWPRTRLMPAFIWGDTGWWYRQALTEYWDAHGLTPKPHAAPDEVQRAVDWWNQRAGGEPGRGRTATAAGAGR